MSEHDIKFKITDAQGGAAFAVRVMPRASKNEISGRYGEAIRVRLAATLAEGAANEALIELLSEKLAVRTNQIEILAGHASRDKIVCVIGLTPQELEQRLEG